MAGVLNTKSVLSLTGKVIALRNEKGSYIKIARLTHSPSSRLVAMITAARVEFSPHANVAILDISARTNAMDSFLHSLIGSKLVNVYYIDNGEYIDVYVSADMTYSRIGVLPLLQYATELTIGSIETISSNAISVEYT